MLRNGISEGTGRGRENIETAIEQGLGRKTRAEAEAFGARLPRLTQKGVPTFMGKAREVLEALESGAIDLFMVEQRKLSDQAKQLTYPQIEEGEDEWMYRQRLETWAADKPESVLQYMGFDAWRISSDTVRARAEAARLAQEQHDLKICREAVTRFHQTGDYTVLTEAKAQVSYFTVEPNAGTDPAYIAAKHPRWAWPCVQAGHITPSAPEMPPPADWLTGLGFDHVDFLVNCAQEAKYYDQRDFRPLFRQQLLKALPYKLDEQHVAIVAGTTLAVDYKGNVMPLNTYGWTNRGDFWRFNPEPQAGEKISTIPHPERWVSIRTVKEWDGTKTIATLYGPDNWNALQAAFACKRGSLHVRGWLAHFGRSPDKGFGRFFFRIQPGGAHWDQMFISVDDRLRDRIELLKQLPDPQDVSYPDDIWYLPARIASRQDKRGHLVWDERADKSLIAWKTSASWVQMSRRSSGSFVSHRSTSTCAAWSLSASTNKHNETMVLALIEEGQELHLDSGKAIRCQNGQLVEIAGGALRPDELPQ